MMVSFPDAVKLFFRRYFDFEGRSSRSEYWWAQLFIWTVIVLLAFVAGFANGGDVENIFETGSSAISGVVFVIGIIFFLAIIIPNIAVAVRRFHDLGQTGWLYLIFAIGGAIPAIGILISLGQAVWFCFRGTIGPNKYGSDPLDPNGEFSIFD